MREWRGELKEVSESLKYKLNEIWRTKKKVGCRNDFIKHEITTFNYLIIITKSYRLKILFSSITQK